MSFGRKGLAGGPVPAGPNALRSGARAPFQSRPGGSDAISSKVDSFLAAERARNAQAAGEGGISSAAASYRGDDRPQRSLPMAYLLWFILGQVSAHRFYLGAYRSAFAQVGLFAFWLLLALGAPEGAHNPLGPILAIAVVGWALWVLGDVFFIHRLHRNNCRRPGEIATVFA